MKWAYNDTQRHEDIKEIKFILINIWNYRSGSFQIKESELGYLFKLKKSQITLTVDQNTYRS